MDVLREAILFLIDCGYIAQKTLIQEPFYEFLSICKSKIKRVMSKNNHKSFDDQ